MDVIAQITNSHWDTFPIPNKPYCFCEGNSTNNQGTLGHLPHPQRAIIMVSGDIPAQITSGHLGLLALLPGGPLLDLPGLGDLQQPLSLLQFPLQPLLVPLQALHSLLQSPDVLLGLRQLGRKAEIEPQTHKGSKRMLFVGN